jgi:large subunit ribosomal protein L24e
LAPLFAENVKSQQLAADKFALEKEIHLVKAPAGVAATKEKLRVAVEQRQAEAMQE